MEADFLASTQKIFTQNIKQLKISGCAPIARRVSRCIRLKERLSCGCATEKPPKSFHRREPHASSLDANTRLEGVRRIPGHQSAPESFRIRKAQGLNVVCEKLVTSGSAGPASLSCFPVSWLPGRRPAGPHLQVLIYSIHPGRAPNELLPT